MDHMNNVDLNLIAALDVLLAERSVTRAAKRLGLSTSAMSRTLIRLRVVTGDSLLVLAGRTLVPTPYAEQIGGQVHDLARAARQVLSPADRSLDVASLDRCFILRTNDGFLERVGPVLQAAVACVAPRVRLRFVPKLYKDAEPLREGMIDLEVGVLGAAAPELHTRQLFRDVFVGICRVGHPLLEKRRLTAKNYVAYRHVVASRKPDAAGPVDVALQRIGLQRDIAMVVPAFSNVLQIVRHSDLLGLVPRSCLAGRASEAPVVAGLAQFELPVATPEIRVSMIWHPRLHEDPAHRWLREMLLAVCRETSGS
jgi:DNA-binding transcriptional LysR family regulator